MNDLYLATRRREHTLSFYGNPHVVSYELVTLGKVDGRFEGELRGTYGVLEYTFVEEGSVGLAFVSSAYRMTVSEPQTGPGTVSASLQDRQYLHETRTEFNGGPGFTQSIGFPPHLKGDNSITVDANNSMALSHGFGDQSGYMASNGQAFWLDQKRPIVQSAFNIRGPGISLGIRVDETATLDILDGKEYQVTGLYGVFNKQTPSDSNSSNVSVALGKYNGTTLKFSGNRLKIGGRKDDSSIGIFSEQHVRRQNVVNMAEVPTLEVKNGEVRAGIRIGNSGFDLFGYVSTDEDDIDGPDVLILHLISSKFAGERDLLIKEHAVLIATPIAEDN